MWRAASQSSKIYDKLLIIFPLISIIIITTIIIAIIIATIIATIINYVLHCITIYSAL